MCVATYPCTDWYLRKRVFPIWVEGKSRLSLRWVVVGTWGGSKSLWPEVDAVFAVSRDVLPCVPLMGGPKSTFFSFVGGSGQLGRLHLRLIRFNMNVIGLWLLHRWVASDCSSPQSQTPCFSPMGSVGVGVQQLIIWNCRMCIFSWLVLLWCVCVRGRCGCIANCVAANMKSIGASLLHRFLGTYRLSLQVDSIALFRSCGEWGRVGSTSWFLWVPNVYFLFRLLLWCVCVQSACGSIRNCVATVGDRVEPSSALILLRVVSRSLNVTKLC